MILQLINPANYSFSIYSVPTFVTAVAILALGLITLLGERNSLVSISFSLMTSTAGVWLLSYSWMYCVQYESLAVVWARTAHLGVTFIPAAVYQFTVGALRLDPIYRKLARLSWLASALFFATVILTDALVVGVYRYWWGFYTRYGWVSAPFLVYFFAMMAASLRHYWVAYRDAPPGAGKLRSKGLLIAFSVAYIGSVDYVAAFGIPVYTIGYLPILAFIVITARTIWRYRLVDITPAFAANEIINAMADALLVLDHDGIVRVANRGACQLFNKTEQELVGAHIRRLMSAISGPESALDRLVLTGSLRDFETSVSGRPDNITTVSTSSYVMHDQSMHPVAFVCIIRNVSRQKQAEEEIRRHTERQAALYEINLATTSTLELRAVLGVLLERLKTAVPDAATTIMLVNSDSRGLTKVASRNIDDEAWKADPGDDGVATEHPVLAGKSAVIVPNIQSRGESLGAEYFRRDGFLSYLGLPLIAKDRVLGILSFYTRDEKTYTEMEVNFLKTLAGQAASAIHNSQLYEQTRQQARDLEEANRIKDEFLSMMSHELRTPLNVISGFTKIVQDGTLGSINPDQVKALEKVSRHSNELLAMVNSIMDATKIEAGALVIEMNEVPLSNFLREFKLLYDVSADKEVALQWDFPSELPVLTTDKEKLKHILQNLINNALKFTERGTVTLSAHHHAGTDSVEFAVTDTGIGIAKADLALIFQKFRQLDSSKTRSRGGVGLGLYIVKTFTELLGGTLRADSEQGKGSAFTVSFPRVPPAAQKN